MERTGIVRVRQLDDKLMYTPNYDEHNEIIIICGKKVNTVCTNYANLIYVSNLLANE